MYFHFFIEKFMDSSLRKIHWLYEMRLYFKIKWALLLNALNLQYSEDIFAVIWSHICAAILLQPLSHADHYKWTLQLNGVSPHYQMSWGLHTGNCQWKLVNPLQGDCQTDCKQKLLYHWFCKLLDLKGKYRYFYLKLSQVFS